MISCGQAVDQLWAYLDGALGATDRAGVDEHLARCRRCCGEMEFAQELRRVLHDAAHELQLPTDVLARLHRTVDDLET